MKIEISSEYYNPLQECLNGSCIPKQHWQELMAEATNFMDTYALRNEYVNHVGYSICTKETLATLTTYLRDKQVLDLGSGSGYLSSLLSQSQVDVHAIDNDSTHKFQQVFQRDSTSDVLGYLAEHGDYTDVIVSWPPYNSSFGHSILTLLKPGTTVWYLGEGPGGCCADDQFFDALDNDYLYLDVPSQKLNSDHLQFSGIHDYWQVYRKD